MAESLIITVRQKNFREGNFFSPIRPNVTITHNAPAPHLWISDPGTPWPPSKSDLGTPLVFRIVQFSTPGGGY